MTQAKQERDTAAPADEARRYRTPDQSADHVEVPGSEGAIYSMQARHAKMAAREALAQAGRHAASAADVRALVRQYPWASTGGAAAVGLVAAWALAPSPRRQAAARLRALERALRTEAAVGTKAFDRKPARGGRMLRLGLRLARPMLMSLVTGAMGGAATGAAAGAQTAAETDPDAEAARQTGEEAAREVARQSAREGAEPSGPGIGDVT